MCSGFNLHLSDGQWCWISFHMLICHLFGEMSLHVLCPFCNSNIFFIVAFWEFLVYFRLFLCQICGLQIYFPVYSLSFHPLFFSRYIKFLLLLLCFSFHPLNRIFCRAKVFNFEEVQFIDFFLMDCAFGVKSKNTLPNPRSWNFSPIFFKSFIVLSFTFKSIIFFKLIFLSDVRFRLRLSFLGQWMSDFSNTICWTSYLSSTELLLYLCQKLVGLFCEGLFLGSIFCSIPLCN